MATELNSVPDVGTAPPVPGFRLLSLRGLGVCLLAVVAFQLALEHPSLGSAVIIYLGCLYDLRLVSTARQAFYAGLLVGLGVFVPQMTFLWTIFGPAAIPLWLVLAFFHGVFLLLLHRVEYRFGTQWARWMAPVLWCGIEYFRSEVWWLRFAWLTAGSPLVDVMWSGWLSPGIYGLGFLTFLLVSLGNFLPRAVVPRTIICISLFLVTLVPLRVFNFWVGDRPQIVNPPTLRVAGVQMEFPGPPEVLFALNRLAKARPEAQLLMLSEYTFDGPVPDSIRAWCRRNQKWLVAGGKAAIESDVLPTANAESTPTRSLQPGTTSAVDARYFNTAYVISTNGEVVFTQAKSRPIQFFKDGEPATQQRVWNSPWGRIGIAICYDVSYRRVMDELVRQGAQALLIPTMDVEQWGRHEHVLNARMARLRATEYGLPVFRVASSGISQLIDSNGRETAIAGFPGSGEIIAGNLILDAGTEPPRLPFDRWLAPICSVCTGATLIWLSVLAVWERFSRKSAV